MSEAKEAFSRADNFEFIQRWYEFSFSLGYQYLKDYDKPNIIYISVAFWHINIIW